MFAIQPSYVMTRIVVTGAAGVVGHRVCRQLADSLGDASVLGIDRRAAAAIPGVDHKQLDLVSADLASLFAGADVVVHMAAVLKAHEQPAGGSSDLLAVRRVLDAAADAGVGHLVLRSSSMVYGAWPDNPVPLTEDAPIRPNPEFAFAVQKAEMERLARDWAGDHPGTVVTVLRPAATVAPDRPGGLARILRSAASIRSDEGDAPFQFVHADDLASAITAAVLGRYDGALNVAPDGWISPEELVALAGPKPRLRLPGWAAKAVSSMRWRLGLAPTPPGVMPYTTYSWVVANDRLRASGWKSTHSNEEAYVVSHEPGPLDLISSRRRQEIALGVAGVAMAGAVGGIVALVVRLRRRRRA